VLHHPTRSTNRSVHPPSRPAPAAPGRRPRWLAVLAVLLGTLPVLSGCADRAWEAALRADEPAAYYRYMRDHPESPRVADAKERLDFHKLKRNLSLPAFEAFVEKYPDSALADEIRPELAPQAFAAARSAGTVEAYQDFLEQFPSGALAARARGNVAYIEAGGFGGRPADLGDFAAAHPESDFAEEARRSAEAASLLARSSFDRVGLAIDISPATPEAAKLHRRFLERARSAYDKSGVELVVLPEIVDPALADRLPRARLTISHEEVEVATSIDGAAVSRPGHLARTQVVLRASPDTPPIFEREFSLRIDSTQHLRGASVLSSTASPRYWERFFVPVASAQTSVLRRPEIALTADAVDVDAAGDRSVVLFEDGRFQVVELANPAEPEVLAEYVRPNDFKKWSGVRILGDRIAIFGEEGIEIVGFGASGPEVVSALSRSDIGTVFALEPIGDHFAVAGARGLMLVDPESGGVKRIMRRVVKGLATVGDTLVFTDGEVVFVSDIALLEQKRVYAQLKLGRAFGPETVRSFGRRAVVVGAAGAIVLDLSTPEKPTVTANLLARDVGRIEDAAGVAGRVFLIGDRGLMLLDPGATRIVQWVDVDGKSRVAGMGRHVVALGERRLQAVDAGPLTAPASLPADRSAADAP